VSYIQRRQFSGRTPLLPNQPANTPNRMAVPNTKTHTHPTHSAVNIKPQKSGYARKLVGRKNCHLRLRRSEFFRCASPNCMRTEKSAIPCRDGCPVQVIPSPSSAKNLSRRNPRGIRVYIRIAESGRFHDATLVRIRQLDRTGGAALPVVRSKGRDLRL